MQSVPYYSDIDSCPGAGAYEYREALVAATGSGNETTFFGSWSLIKWLSEEFIMPRCSFSISF